MTQNFINEIKRIGFVAENKQEDCFEIRNRRVAYDNDCSDDDRDDEFYERYSDEFNQWASPIKKKVRELATAHKVKIEFETASQYGSIIVYVN